MAHTEQHIEAEIGSQEAFEQMVSERLRYAVRVALISVLEEEVTAVIGAQPYERTQERRDQRNGHYTRHLETTVGQIADLPVPRTRGGYQTQLFERYHRRQDELDSAIGEMFVKGVSTTKVGQVIETLTGSHPSASTVSRSLNKAMRLPQFRVAISLHQRRLLANGAQSMLGRAWKRGNRGGFGCTRRRGECHDRRT